MRPDLEPSASTPEPLVVMTRSQLKQVIADVLKEALAHVTRAEPKTAELTAEQVARRLRVRDGLVLAALRSGQLPGRQSGRAWRVRPDDADQWMRTQQLPSRFVP